MRVPNENASNFGRTGKETEVQNHFNPNLQMLLNRLEHVRPAGRDLFA